MALDGEIRGDPIALPSEDQSCRDCSVVLVPAVQEVTETRAVVDVTFPEVVMDGDPVLVMPTLVEAEPSPKELMARICTPIKEPAVEKTVMLAEYVGAAMRGVHDKPASVEI